ncbi:MAG: IS21 family transposase [Hylemonella sp.]|nr:IS21 family transposase [Hylemonella sp.]
MPQQRMDIRMIKDILRLKYQGGLSHGAIASSLCLSKGVVAKYLRLAGAAGLDWQATADLDEASLERRLLGRSVAQSRVVEPDFARVHIELHRKGVTLMLLWQEYRASHEGQRTWAYTQFCGHYKRFAKGLKRSMRQHRRAGEKLFIDYAGATLELADGTRAQIFVAAMGASSYTFAWATVDQSMRSWLGATARALSFYGGVPQLIVPDNPRALVSKACRYEPRLNETVRDFARHYGCSILPARPYSPKDKASAESAVQVVERWLMARLRHTVLADVAAANVALGALLAWLNERAFQKLDGSRASLFATLDSAALSPLPAQPWQWASFKTVTVHIDYHVEVEAHRYSVPHALVGSKLEARTTDALVELLHRGKRVACHARSAHAGGFTTLDEHMPAAHRAHKQWTPERLIHWGNGIGANTGRFVTQLLQRFRHPEHGYRSCLGLLSLAKRYGPQRVDLACMLALELGAGQYRHVRDILANGRDLVKRPAPEPEWVAPEHDNLRGAAYYH